MRATFAAVLILLVAGSGIGSGRASAQSGAGGRTMIAFHGGGARTVDDGPIDWGETYTYGLAMLYRLSPGLYVGGRIAHGRWNRTNSLQNAEYLWSVGPLSITEISSAVRTLHTLDAERGIEAFAQLGAGYYDMKIEYDYERSRCLYCRDVYDIGGMIDGLGGRPGLSIGAGLLARNSGGKSFEFMLLYHYIISDNEPANQYLTAFVGITLRGD